MRHSDPRSLPRTSWPVERRFGGETKGPAEIPVWDRENAMDFSDIMDRSRRERAIAMKSFFGSIRRLLKERLPDARMANRRSGHALG